MLSNPQFSYGQSCGWFTLSGPISRHWYFIDRPNPEQGNIPETNREEKKERFKYITETITEDSDDEECINPEGNAFRVFKID